MMGKKHTHTHKHMHMHALTHMLTCTGNKQANTKSTSASGKYAFIKPNSVQACSTTITQIIHRGTNTN